MVDFGFEQEQTLCHGELLSTYGVTQGNSCTNLVFTNGKTVFIHIAGNQPIAEEDKITSHIPDCWLCTGKLEGQDCLELDRF